MSTQDTNTHLSSVIDRDAPADRIVKALSDALTAEEVFRDGSRGPSHRIRVDAAKALLAYRVGTPIQRSEITHIEEKDDSKSMEELLRRSPAMRDSLRKILARVEAPIATIEV